MHSIKKIIILGILYLSLLTLSCDSAKQTERPPNIIIVFADDMGYGDLSCYGHPNIETPQLDKMAEEGIRFTSFYAAASVCTPSRAALLTGRYPIRNTPHNFGPESKDGLPVDEITLADILRNHDYSTMAIGKWHLGHQPEYLPTSRGFDSFYGLPYSNDMILPWCPWLTEEDKLFLYEDSVATREIGYGQDDLTVNYTKKAVEFIRRHKDGPFFLYLAHSMPHLPISTSKEFIGKSKAGLYGDVIETIDWSTGELLSTLKTLGIDDNTIMVFASDNGPWQNLPERMLQKGVEHWHAGSAGLLRGSKATSYEGGFRVPAIIRWPVKISAGTVSNEIVTTMDIFSTLVHAAGAALPSDRIIDGTDISGLLQDNDNKATDTFFYLRGTTVEAVRKGSWKLRNTQTSGIELFNLDLDPSEMYNRAEDEIERVEELLQELKTFASETEARLIDR